MALHATEKGDGLAHALFYDKRTAERADAARDQPVAADRARRPRRAAPRRRAGVDRRRRQTAPQQRLARGPERRADGGPDPAVARRGQPVARLGRSGGDDRLHEVGAGHAWARWWWTRRCTSSWCRCSAASGARACCARWCATPSRATTRRARRASSTTRTCPSVKAPDGKAKRCQGQRHQGGEASARLGEALELRLCARSASRRTAFSWAASSPASADPIIGERAPPLPTSTLERRCRRRRLLRHLVRAVPRGDGRARRHRRAPRGVRLVVVDVGEPEARVRAWFAAHPLPAGARVVTDATADAGPHRWGQRRFPTTFVVSRRRHPPHQSRIRIGLRAPARRLGGKRASAVALGRAALAWRARRRRRCRTRRCRRRRRAA